MQNLAPNGKILRSFANFYVRKTWKAVMLATGRDSRERGSHLQPVTSTTLLWAGAGTWGRVTGSQEITSWWPVSETAPAHLPAERRSREVAGMISPEARRKKLTLGCSVQDPLAGALHQAGEALLSIQSWAKFSLFKQFLGFGQQTGESGGGDRIGRGNYVHWNSSSLLGHWPTTEHLCGPSTSLCCLPHPLVPKLFRNLQKQKKDKHSVPLHVSPAAA